MEILLWLQQMLQEMWQCGIAGLGAVCGEPCSRADQQLSQYCRKYRRLAFLLDQLQSGRLGQGLLIF